MEKKSIIRLPKGKVAKNVQYNCVDGSIELSYEVEDEFKPKDGDFISTKDGRVFIYNNKYTSVQYGAYCGIDIYNNIIINDCNLPGWTGKEGCRYATPEEKADFLERLEKECGKLWNPDTKQIEDIRWRAEENKLYYFINDHIGISTTYDGEYSIDNERHKVGNYFRTSEAAQKVADQIKEIFKNSKPE